MPVDKDDAVFVNFKRGWFRVMHFIFPELTAASNLNVDPLENSTKVAAST